MIDAYFLCLSYLNLEGKLCRGGRVQQVRCRRLPNGAQILVSVR